MLRIALRDLQWRTRRIVIAIAGAALVLALALAVSGLSAGFDNEAGRTVSLARATGWVIDIGGTGPFLQPTPLSPATVKSIVDSVGAEHAAPILFGRQSVGKHDGSHFDEKPHVNLVGVQPGRLGSPEVRHGTALAHDGDAVVDATLGAKIGEKITLGRSSFTVVGIVTGARLLAGVPNVYIPLTQAQQLNFGGRNLATAVVVDRQIRPPAGTKILSNAEAVADGIRPVINAQKTIGMVRSLLWLVAALIVGSIMYLGVLERTKDVAVLKGMGAKSGSLAASVAIQAALLAFVAALFGAVIAALIAPLFPLSAEIPGTSYVLLPIVAVIVGLVASLGATRRLFSIQPALAFGS
jgi:putative ABC transport system permease protein